MGVKDLSKAIKSHAPNSVKTNDIKAYQSRKIAVDASNCLYQFLIGVRQDDGMCLTDENGNSTSHLSGMFYRTIRLMENGIKLVFVFDGPPPRLKDAELEKRDERRADARFNFSNANDICDFENADKFFCRTVKATEKQIDEVKRLLKLMGVPVIDAPCEAEAQCAELVKAGKVFATATENMSALPFGSKTLVRHLSLGENGAEKKPIEEYNLDHILKGFDFTMDQFIDYCILLGCDYCPSIYGIGKERGYELITKYKSIERILKHLDDEKYPPPRDWQYAAARKLFAEPDVVKADKLELKWSKPDEDGIIEFLCKEKGFNEDKVKAGLKRLQNCRGNFQQSRVDSFFPSIGLIATEPTAQKRKAQKEKASGLAKKRAKKIK